ncbi:MAG TPA: FUSC family protein [Pseudolysinimonas sp.]|nr:FUSC family protein [Pseudolysinimonas sp.]
MSEGTAAARELRKLERRIRRQIDVKIVGRRVWDSLPAIIQIVLGVAASFSIAHWGLGHPVPILAITVTMTSLGLTRDARPRRIAESVVGIVLGIAVAESFVLLFGTSVIQLVQLVIVLLVVFVVGRAVSANPGFALAAAVPSAIVIVLPPAAGGPFTRTLDGLVGGLIALLVTALIPRDPRRSALRDGHTLFSVLEESLGSVAECLAHGDAGAGELALSRLRRTQPLIDAWRTSHDTALSVARISPFLRRFVPELQRHSRLIEAADLTARHLRHISRRSEFLARDGRPRPELAGVLGELVTAIHLLGSELDDPQMTGAARSLLTDLARRLDPAIVMPNAGVAESSLFMLVRPLTVDLLVGSGSDLEAARALLPRLD